MPVIEILYPLDGDIDIPTVFTAEGTVDSTLEITGLVSNPATGDVWIGYPQTQVVDPGPPPGPDWYIDFPAPLDPPIPPSTLLSLGVFATDFSASANIFFTTAAASAMIVASTTHKQPLQAKSWDAILIDDVRVEKRKVTVAGRAPNHAKAPVVVFLIGKAELQAGNRRRGPRRNFVGQKGQSAGGKFTIVVAGVPTDTYRVYAVVKGGRQVARWPAEVVVK